MDAREGRDACVWNFHTGQKGAGREERLSQTGSLKTCFSVTLHPTRADVDAQPSWSRAVDNLHDPTGPPGTATETHPDRLRLKVKNETVKALEAESICPLREQKGLAAKTPAELSTRDTADCKVR